MYALDKIMKVTAVAAPMIIAGAVTDLTDATGTWTDRTVPQGKELNA